MGLVEPPRPRAGWLLARRLADGVVERAPGGVKCIAHWAQMGTNGNGDYPSVASLDTLKTENAAL